jgi:virginiamycin B lyase
MILGQIHETWWKNKLKDTRIKLSVLVLLSVVLFSFLSSSDAFAQESIDEFVTYSKKSNFIKEIPFPNQDLGLRGITTDKNGNAWIYHSTQNASSIFKFDPVTEKFSNFDILKKTNTKDVIVTLSGGHIIYDESRNTIWFTDARTNSVGKFDIENKQIDIIDIPTENSGPMGLILSPDKSQIWFTELSSDKFASLDIKTNEIKEYQIKENSGPISLAFDEKGSLLITLAYSNSVLIIDVTNISDTILNISEITLPKPDFFSPFGIAILKDSKGVEKLILSDHSSSRIIVSELDSSLKTYTSLWTSPNTLYPQTLPSQIDLDESGNIYFVQHGGNKISKIDKLGTITEYDIPTGPLSTTVYLDASKDGKVWFTEVLANKIGYLDANISIPFDIQVDKEKIDFTEKEMSKQVKVTVSNMKNNNDLVSLDNINISVVGMTDSGLDGVSFTATPSVIDLNQENKIESTIDLSVDKNTKPGIYQIMIKVSSSEQIDKTMTISKLYPLTINIDLPKPIPPTTIKKTDSDSEFIIKDIIQNAAIGAIIILVSLLVYKKIKLARQNKISKQE